MLARIASNSSTRQIAVVFPNEECPRHHGTPYWTGLPALPPRRPEVILEGDTLRHPEVRRRSSRRGARHAPVPPEQGQRILDPAPREAEGQALLRDLRAAVPQVFR